MTTPPIQPHFDALSTQTAIGVVPAQIIQLIDSDRVTVSWAPYHHSETAEIAIPLALPFQVGDRVLLQRGESAAYIVGILGAARRRQQQGPQNTVAATPTEHNTPHTTATPTGPNATSPITRQQKHIELRGQDGQLRATYDLGNDQLRIVGAVHVAVERDLELESGGTLKLTGESIELAAQRHFLVQLSDTTGNAKSALGITPHESRWSSANINIDGHKITTSARSQTFEGESVEFRVGRLSMFAKNLYQRVEDLSQRLSGRVRELVKGRWHVDADNARLRGKNNVQVQGKKIHLG